MQLHHVRTSLPACLFTAAMFAGDAAGTINNHPDSEAGFSALYGHCVFLPDGYSSTGPLLPLIVSLGGVGERGNGDSELASVRRAGPLGYIDQNAAVRTYLGTTKPCIVLSWQIPAGTNYSIGDTEEMISYAIATYRVDPRRIHLTGLSLGGGHAWKYAVAMPDRIASLVPVCGSSGPTNQEGVAELGKLPIWAHHNAGDTLVIAKDTSFPWCRQAAQGRGGTAEPSPILSFPYALDSSSGRPTYTGHYGPTTGWVWFNGVSSSFGADRPLLTIYPAVGHGGWDAAYSATGTYAWMQSQAPNPTELVIDNRSSKQISASGAWARTTGGGGCYGGDATRLPANSASGSFAFRPVFQRRGSYQVQMRWPTLSTQSASLPVSIVHSGGTAQVQVNQSVNGGVWNTLGSWTFAAGSGSSVTIQGSNLAGIAARRCRPLHPQQPVPDRRRRKRPLGRLPGDGLAERQRQRRWRAGRADLRVVAGQRSGNDRVLGR